MESGLLGEEQSEPAALLPHFQYRKHSRTENLSIRLPKLKMPTVPCVNYCSLIGYWSEMGAHFWTWSKSRVRIVLNVTGVKKQFCREDFCPKTWKFYKDNLSWEMFPQKPQQGTWMFRLTSAEEVHAPGSRCGICGKDPTLIIRASPRGNRGTVKFSSWFQTPLPQQFWSISRWRRTEQHHSKPRRGFWLPASKTPHLAKGHFLRWPRGAEHCHCSDILCWVWAEI